MRIDGSWCAKRFADEDLPGSVGDVFFSADDMGDTHDEVICDNGEMIDGVIDRAGNDDIAELGGIEGDFSAYFVDESDGFAGIFQAPHFGPLSRRQFAFLFREIRLPLPYQFLEMCAMDVFAFGLAAKLVPRESKPCEVVEVGILILPLASGGIGVFGTEDDFSAMFFRKEIIEKERTDIADMHIPGRAGRHAYHYFFFFVIAHVRDRCRRVVSQAFVRRRPVRTRAPLCSCALAMRGRS